ncbi:RluA family pseudouridine synthase [Gluconacetobacter tumulisoli]|uniref:Pseudouridine synthase n=1 Tax=Gluconacetobacter tumulisoli TaxID=1286189 RepID=A0A7W4K6U1_9PROT|nr:RluA family pseudouridine synthase [Gluconacetobacter tumulisoli]MBB2201315.1 RluA family pseudouridine synthase [Gluconacetobacter tumulisoli]
MTDDTQPVFLTAGAEHAGQRTDRFLADAIGTLSRSRVKALMEGGHVSRAGVPLREPSDPVRAGMCYEIRQPPAIPATPVAQAIPFVILHEDSDLIVLDKPAGLVVHPAPGNEDGTLVNALLAHCGDSLTGIGGERRPGIVHRLDKDTSGVMVVAKTERAHTALSAAFAARDIDRTYLALSWGILAPAAGSFEGAIGRDRRDRKRMSVVHHGGGKHALTHYRTLQTFHGAASYVECRLATGRTHQIRVHFSTAGHPLLGDPVYLRRIPAASRGLPDEARRAALDFPRQALHAARLGFVHPGTGESMLFETPPPDDFQTLLEKIA